MKSADCVLGFFFLIPYKQNSLPRMNGSYSCQREEREGVRTILLTFNKALNLFINWHRCVATHSAEDRWQWFS